MTDRVKKGRLKIARIWADFISTEALPGTGVDEAHFWAGLESLVHDLAPRNRTFVAKRADLQGKIDAWHVARKGKPHDAAAYKAMLTEIGYLVPEGPDFKVETTNVDDEIATIAGP